MSIRLVPDNPSVEIDDAFGHWFAGFADGEGCFRIKTTNQGTYQCRFSIGLRADDAPILREIHGRLGIGILIHSGRTNIHQEQWRLEVNSKAHVRRLVDIFDRYPLRAKKAADFAIWREAVFLWCKVENGKRHDWHELAALSTALREGRVYRAA
jgi:hypothetical protein